MNRSLALNIHAARFRDGLIAEDWVITDLAERLLLAKNGD